MRDEAPWRLPLACAALAVIGAAALPRLLIPARAVLVGVITLALVRLACTELPRPWRRGVALPGLLAAVAQLAPPASGSPLWAALVAAPLPVYLFGCGLADARRTRARRQPAGEPGDRLRGAVGLSLWAAAAGSPYLGGALLLTFLLAALRSVGGPYRRQRLALVAQSDGWRMRRLLVGELAARPAGEPADAARAVLASPGWLPVLAWRLVAAPASAARRDAADAAVAALLTENVALGQRLRQAAASLRLDSGQPSDRDPERAAILAEVCFRLGRLDEAAAMAEAARAGLHPPRSLPGSRLSRHLAVVESLALARAGRTIDAEALLDQLGPAPAGDPDAAILGVLAEAVIGLARGQADGLVERLRDLPWSDLAEDPLAKEWRSYANLLIAEALLSQGDAARAAVYAAAPGSDALPSCPEAGIILARARRQLGDRTGAADALEWTIAQTGDEPHGRLAKLELAGQAER